MTLVIDFLILGTITLVLYWCNEIYKKNRQLSHIPGPLPIPFIGLKLPGNIYEIKDFFDNLTQKYGKTIKYYLGNTLTVATCDPDLIQAILQSSIHLNKSTLYDLTRPWLRDGLILSTGDKWRQRRKLASQSFHLSILKDFFAVFKDSSDNIIRVFQEEADKGNIIDAMDFFSKYALDVIGETTFGIKLNIQKGGNKAYIEAVDFMHKLVHTRNFSLWKRLNLPFRLFAEEYKQQEKALNILDNTALQIIENKRKELKNMDLAQDSQNISKRKRFILIDTLIQNPEMSNDDILEEVNNFLFAGYETTSTLTSSILYELAQHLDIQEKVYQEILLCTNNDVDQITFETLQKMCYIDQVIKETLRLRSTGAFMERKITEDAKFGETIYPKGTVFTILIYWLHNSSLHYQDPEKFDPDRFLPENHAKRHPFAFIPFSAGLRNCIGQKYALLEVKTVITRILMDFKILPVEGSKMVIGFSGVLKSKYGFPIKLQRRK